MSELDEAKKLLDKVLDMRIDGARLVLIAGAMRCIVDHLARKEEKVPPCPHKSKDIVVEGVDKGILRFKCSWCDVKVVCLDWVEDSKDIE